MNARRKLNRAYFAGSVLLAAAAGGLTQSMLVFIVALAVSVACNLYLGEIRLRRRHRPETQD